MKRYCLFILLFFLNASANTQSKYTDSLRHQLAIEKNDTARLVIYELIKDYYFELKPDSALIYSEPELQLVQKLKLRVMEAAILNNIGYSLRVMGNYSEAMQKTLDAITIAEEKTSSGSTLPLRYLKQMPFPVEGANPEDYRLFIIYDLHHNLGHIYQYVEAYDLQLQEYFQALKIAEKSGLAYIIWEVTESIGRAYTRLGKYDEALKYLRKAYNLAHKISYKRHLVFMLTDLGSLYLYQKNITAAKQSFHEGIASAMQQDNMRGLIGPYNGLAKAFLMAGETDSSLWYAHSGLQLSKLLSNPRGIYAADTLLAAIHNSNGQMDSAFYYQESGIREKDKFFNPQKLQQLQNIVNAENQRRADLEAAKTAYKN